MQADDAAVAMNQRDFRIRHLTRSGLPAQLTHAFVHMKHAAGHTGMRG